MAQEIADSTLLDTWASGGNIVEPDISKIIEGWQLGEQPPHEYMNWLQNTFGSKLNHILKNGVAKWDDETPYLSGSSVQHNGNVWLCKATNTNSAPTDSNSNWKRIITIEALENLLSGYVALTGNQTIAGVKTFGSSPIVPTPTTGTQAVNKEYVDNGAGATFVANDDRVKTALNATGTAPIYACRAWVNFNGTGTVAIRASGNVSSITDNGVGDYKVNFTIDMPDINYEINNFETRGIPQPLGAGNAIFINNCHTFNVSSFVIESLNYIGTSNTMSAVDAAVISISIFR